MAQPQAYNRETDFTERDGDDTNHAGINTELDAAALSINEIRDNLALIQRDDGTLANESVGAEQLSPDAFTALQGNIADSVAAAESAAASAVISATAAVEAAADAASAIGTVNAAAAASALNATSAAGSATGAAASAATATTQASAASASATAAADSAATATTQAGTAATSATNASNSATAAAGSASAAAGSATAASGSATTAATQATNASNSATAAAASATAAATSFDDFDDRYLGAKTSNPVQDNDGGTLIVGALYFNTSVGEMRVWTGAVWTSVPGTPADGSVTTQKLAAVIAPVVSSINGGPLAGMRNKIINGKMEIAQRGTSFAGQSLGGATGVFAADRFSFGGAGNAALGTVSQQLDAPAAAPEFQYSARVSVDTQDSSVAAGDVSSLQHVIEGFNIRDLIGRTFTLSFWVRSSKTGIHCVSFRNSGLNRSYVVEYTISAANTWERKTITVPAGLITAGTWNYTNGAGLYVNWALMCGTSFQTTANAWQTGDFLGTANQVNVLDSFGNIFAVTGVQLEVGTEATPFEQRPIGLETALCQRYYQTTNMNLRVPQSDTGIIRANTFLFPVSMRAAPTVIVGPPASAWDTGPAITPSTYGFELSGMVVSSANGQRVAGYTAVAEL